MAHYAHHGEPKSVHKESRCRGCTIAVSDYCTAGELDVPEMTIKHVLPLLVRVRTTEEVIAALRKA